MTSKPWMPLYIADYLADTAHLGALESGGYLHLIMHYWQNGGLPTEDRHLARIARMTDQQWADARSTIADFFQPDWSHKRIDKELANAKRVSRKRSASAKQRWSKGDATDMQLHTQSQSHSQEEKTDAAPDGAHSDEADLFRRGKKLLGKNSGGLITQLLQAKNKNIALARSALELAATKQDPREYLGAIIRGRDSPEDLRAKGEAW